MNVREIIGTKPVFSRHERNIITKIGSSVLVGKVVKMVIGHGNKCEVNERGVV